MELARARAGATGDPTERDAALARAGDAYERARAAAPRGPGGEADPPGRGEALWRGLGRALAGALAVAPRLRRRLEDRLLAGPGAGPG
jgi:hypothetical protein